MKRASLSAVLAVAGFAGCGDDAPIAADAAAADATVETFDSSPDPDAEPLPPPTGVDILFVIDNSHAMAEEQAAFVDGHLGAFLAALEAAHGSRPDLHIGVISTDMGAFPVPVGTCVGPGDAGRLQIGLPGVGCPALDGGWISDVSDGAGGRIVNYTGAIEDVFACQAQLGNQGCGFEQPLASLEAALISTDNVGFLRADAALAVIFLGDEDDCSAVDIAVYDPSQNDPDDPLGPLSSFRCFEFGVVCAPDQPRVHGVKTGCTVRTDSYLSDPSVIADAVHAIRPPGRVAVAVITGDPAPVEVGPDPETPQNPALLQSCESSNGVAAPGIRLHAFAAEFGADSSTGSICGSLSEPLETLATQIAAMIE